MKKERSNIDYEFVRKNIGVFVGKCVEFMAAESAPKDILEIGANIPSPLAKLFRKKFDGCNYLETNLDAKPPIDVCAIDFEDAKFDCVVCAEVLEHVKYPWIAMQEMARILRPKGWLIVTVPFFIEYHWGPEDHWRFSPTGLRILFDLAKVTPVLVETKEKEKNRFQNVMGLARNG